VVVAATADHVLAPHGQRARLARADGDRGRPRRERKGGRAVQCDQGGLAVRTCFGFGFGLGFGFGFGLRLGLGLGRGFGFGFGLGLALG